MSDHEKRWRYRVTTDPKDGFVAAQELVSGDVHSFEIEDLLPEVREKFLPGREFVFVRRVRMEKNKPLVTCEFVFEGDGS